MKILILPIISVLAGCASLPGPPAATPALTSSVMLPNCVMLCKVLITNANADALSTSSAPITMGTQNVDLDTGSHNGNTEGTE